MSCPLCGEPAEVDDICGGCLDVVGDEAAVELVRGGRALTVGELARAEVAETDCEWAAALAKYIDPVAQ